MAPYVNNHRLLAALFLMIAIVMLAVGGAVLSGWTDPLARLMYWTVCLLATFGSIICAALDTLRSLSQSRRERRALIEGALYKIEAEQANRAQRNWHQKDIPSESR